MPTTATATRVRAAKKAAPAAKKAAPTEETTNLVAEPAAEPTTPEPSPEEIATILAEIRPWVEYKVGRWANEYGRPDAALKAFETIFGAAMDTKKPPKAKLDTIKNHVVDETFKLMRANGWCDNAMKGLTLVFGHPTDADGNRLDQWYDKNGRDCRGYDKHGLDEDGANRDGIRTSDGRYKRKVDGVVRWFDQRTNLDEDGYGYYGYNADGFNRKGRHQDGHWISPEAEAASMVDGLSPELQAALVAALAAQPAAA